MIVSGDTIQTTSSTLLGIVFYICALVCWFNVGLCMAFFLMTTSTKYTFILSSTKVDINRYSGCICIHTTS